MRLSRFALAALATAVVSAFGASPARADGSYDLCLGLNSDDYGQYFITFVVQGNAILVSGQKGHGSPDDHGPLFGALSQAPSAGPVELGQTGPVELGLTVTFKNAGDYTHQNTEHVVFTFSTNGDITYKRWLHAGTVFTQGTAGVIACH